MSKHQFNYRPLISVAEYEKQGSDFTRQELQRAALYHKHRVSVTVQRLTDAHQRLDPLQRMTLWTGVTAVLLAFMLILIGSGAFGGTASTSTSDGSSGLVPLSFPQRIVRLPQEFVDLVRSLTGYGARKGITQGSATPPSHTLHRQQQQQQQYHNAHTTTTHHQQPNQTHEVSDREDEAAAHMNRQLTDEEYDMLYGAHAYEFNIEDVATQQQGQEHLAVDTSSTLAAYLPHNLNIFAFAYATAKGWAATLYSLTFGV